LATTTTTIFDERERKKKVPRKMFTQTKKKVP
jgi:hypothetical protein